MGTTIELNKLLEGQELYRLLVYCKALQKTLSAATSINRLLAEELLKYKPSQRTMQLEKCFNRILDDVSDGTVIKDIDVMFNPEYKVDVLKILIAANKRKPFSLIWPGRYEDGKLIYSEEGYPDYRIYEISNYDIMCVV